MRKAVQSDVSFDVLALLLKREVYTHNLPDDVSVVVNAVDPFRDTINIFLFSESFEPVPEGESLPYMVVVYKKMGEGD